ncbi:MAG: hypothetical protein ACD_83C00190G0001, partial [uncultured bacterium]
MKVTILRETTSGSDQFYYRLVNNKPSCNAFYYKQLQNTICLSLNLTLNLPFSPACPE